MARDIRLVYPGAGQVEPRGQLVERLFQGGAAAGLQSLAGLALEHDIVHAALTAQLALVLTVAILVDHQAVGVNDIEGGEKI